MYMYMYMKKAVMVGPDKPSLDSGCFELISSHQQGMAIACLDTHTQLYLHKVNHDAVVLWHYNKKAVHGALKFCIQKSN